jgi:hypothetical protein
MKMKKTLLPVLAFCVCHGAPALAGTKDNPNSILTLITDFGNSIGLCSYRAPSNAPAGRLARAYAAQGDEGINNAFDLNICFHTGTFRLDLELDWEEWSDNNGTDDDPLPHEM